MITWTIKDAAADYIAAGFALCQPTHGTKSPEYKNWQHKPRSIDDINESAGLGLLHVQSGTCVIDLDDLHQASEWLLGKEIDVSALLEDDEAVQITSRRPNRAKLVYRLPPGVDALPTHKLQTPDGNTMIEFRCASTDGTSLQDVLPPSIHPDTGKPYEWAGAGDLHNLPQLPDALLALWQNIGSNTPAKAPTEALDGAIVEGGRNDALFKKAGDMAYLKLPEAAINAALQEVNSQQCKPPLPSSEVATIARSASKTSKGAKLAKVDLSGLLNKIDPETGEILERIPHISEVSIWAPGIEASVPDHLLTLPHPLLERVAGLIGGSAETTDKALNVAGVVHLAAATVARTVRSNKANCAALFLGNVARSGAGKNASKNYVARCLDRAFSLGVVSNFSSGSGIFSAIRNTPACVMHLDEFGDKLGHGLKDSAGSNVAKGFSDLKEIYSQCDDRLSPATFSLISFGQKAREDFLRSNGPIHKPHLNLLAVTTPGQLNDAVTQASVEGGLINRFLFVSACGQLQENEEFDPVPPEWLVKHMRYARNGGAPEGNLTDLLPMLEDPDSEPAMRVFSLCDVSMRMLNDFKVDIRRLGKNDEFMADLSQRWRENAMRMALALHAFSEPMVTTIDPVITKWCIDYCRFYGRQFAMRLLELATPKEYYGKRRQEYLNAFRAHPEGTSSHMLGKKSPWRNDPQRFRSELINDMVSAGDLAVVVGEKPARGPAPKLYVSIVG